MNKPKPNSAFPDTISLADLRWLLDLSTSHINGLERESMIEKTARGTYTLESIRNYVRTMRKRGAGPTAWNQARTQLMRERARITRLDRFEREKRTIPVSEVLATSSISRPDRLAALLGPRRP
jgi:hypothetical protein